MKVSVIGLGRMGLRHLRIVADLEWDIVGIVDSNKERLSSTGKEYSIPENLCFGNPSGMYKKTLPDCVIIATTAPGHGPLTCGAAEAGVKYVLCEKPMASSLLDCDRMIEVCKNTGTRLAINHQMRFMDQYLKAKEIIESDEFGGLSSVTVSAGNFGIAMNGTHYFELFRWLTQENPYEVSGWFSPEKISNPRGPQFEDNAGSIRIVTASGKRFYMEIGADQGHGIRVVYAGKSGIMVADELKGSLEVSVRQKEHRELPTTRYGMPSQDRSIIVKPADTVSPSRSVLESLVKGGDIPTGEDGRWAVTVLAGAYLSNENGSNSINLLSGELPRSRKFPYA